MLSNRGRSAIDVGLFLFVLFALFLLYMRLVFFVFRDAPVWSILLGSAVLLVVTAAIARRLFW